MSVTGVTVEGCFHPVRGYRCNMDKRVKKLLDEMQAAVITQNISTFIRARKKLVALWESGG